MTRFCRYDLRTTDAEAARLFYATVLGHERARIWPLHEQAIARGARPHWLGQIATTDVEATASAFVERGAMRFGPTGPTSDGGLRAVLRDPGGAVVGLATPPAAPEPLEPVWQVLHANEAPRAATSYHELFGWELRGRIDLGAEGTYERFAWEKGGDDAGAIGDIAGRPGVHPHWLFFFEVDALSTAINAVSSHGGVVVATLTLPNGARLAACDDAQGAAFGLRERGPSA